LELVYELRAKPMAWKELLSPNRRVRRRAIKQLSVRVPLKPLSAFFYLYVIKRGFLDGYPGFLYCSLVAAHHVHIQAKLAERAHRGTTLPLRDRI
jgi:hypothetical protein